MFVGLAIVAVVALPRASILLSPWFWGAAFVVIGLRQLATWHTIDDHIIVTTYWCAALALGLTARVPAARSPPPPDCSWAPCSPSRPPGSWGPASSSMGRFFRYTLLFDDRFETVARWIGGSTPEDHRANVDAVNGLLAVDAARTRRRAGWRVRATAWWQACSRLGGGDRVRHRRVLPPPSAPPVRVGAPRVPVRLRGHDLLDRPGRRVRDAPHAARCLPGLLRADPADLPGGGPRPRWCGPASGRCSSSERLARALWTLSCTACATASGSHGSACSSSRRGLLHGAHPAELLHEPLLAHLARARGCRRATLRVIRLPRSSRWKVIAKRWASSRIRWSR